MGNDTVVVKCPYCNAERLLKIHEVCKCGSVFVNIKMNHSGNYVSYICTFKDKNGCNLQTVNAYRLPRFDNVLLIADDERSKPVEDKPKTLLTAFKDEFGEAQTSKTTTPKPTGPSTNQQVHVGTKNKIDVSLASHNNKLSVFMHIDKSSDVIISTSRYQKTGKYIGPFMIGDAKAIGFTVPKDDKQPERTHYVKIDLIEYIEVIAPVCDKSEPFMVLDKNGRDVAGFYTEYDHHNDLDSLDVMNKF